jgi:hypothetical protein
MKKIGSFTLTDGNLLVSDPCYDKGTWCTALFKALPGKYNVFVNQHLTKYIDNTKTNHKGLWNAITQYMNMKDKLKAQNLSDEEISNLIQVPNVDDYYLEEEKIRYMMLDLIIVHESLPEEFASKVNGRTKKSVFVDSGQCGFFDYDRFPDVPDDRCFEPGKEKKWTETWYGQLCDKNSHENGFVADYGTATHTAYGDGSAIVYTRKNNKGLVVAARLDYIGCARERKELAKTTLVK